MEFDEDTEGEELYLSPVPEALNHAGPPHSYNPVLVRRYDEYDELSEGHSPALYATGH